MNKINWQQIPVVNAGGVEQSVPEHLEDLYDLIESSEMEFPVPEFPDDILYSAESSEGLVWNEVNFKEKLDEVLYKLKGEQLFKGAVTQIEIEGQPWYKLGDGIELENNKFYLHVIQIPYSDGTFDWFVYLCRSVETVEDGLHLRALSVSSDDGFDFLEEPILISKYYNDTLVSRVGSLTGINSLYQINDIDISDYSDIVTILELYFDSLIRNMSDLVGGPYLTVDDSYETDESHTSVEILYASDIKCSLFDEQGHVDPRIGLVTNSLPESSIDEQVNIGFAYALDSPIELDENGIPVDLNMLRAGGVMTWDGYSQWYEDVYAPMGYPCSGPGFSFKIQPSTSGGDLYLLNGHDIQRTEGHIYFIIWREVFVPGDVIVHEPFVDAVGEALEDLLYDVHAEVLTSRELVPDNIERGIVYEDISYSNNQVVIPIDIPVDTYDDDSIYMFSIIGIGGEGFGHSHPMIKTYGKKYSEWMQFETGFRFAKFENLNGNYKVPDNGSAFYMDISDAMALCKLIEYDSNSYETVTFKLYKVPSRFKDLDKWSDLIAFLEMGQIPTKKDIENNITKVLGNLYKHQFKPLSTISYQFVTSENGAESLINSWRLRGIYNSAGGSYFSSLNVNKSYISGDAIRQLQPGEKVIALEFDGTVIDINDIVTEYYPDFEHLVNVWEGTFEIGDITLPSDSIVVTNSRYAILTNMSGEKMFIYHDTDNVSHDVDGGSTRFNSFDGTNWYTTPADGNMLYILAQREIVPGVGIVTTGLDSDSALNNPDDAIFASRILRKLVPEVVSLHSNTITATPTAVSTEFFLSGGDLTGAIMAQVFVNGLREFGSELWYDTVNDTTIVRFDDAPPQNSSIRVDIITQ